MKIITNKMKIIINKIKDFGELTFSDYIKEIYMVIVIINLLLKKKLQFLLL